MKNKILLFIVLLIYITIPIIIFNNQYLYDIKFYILTILGLFIYLLFRILKVKNENLGITKSNLLPSIKRNCLLIVIMVVGIIVMSFLGLKKYDSNETIWFYIFYIFISCPIQEFLYRAVFGYFDKVYNNKYLFTILSSLMYSFVHIIYKDYLTCILTFIIGIIWYILYRKDKNILGVTLAHIVLGILTISLGIIN
ncbi:MAG: CPBP family intramembrane metalloprotease [Bacilli bacterium]|nr:CPBP family intramembrane metalloprotease [Bacilli bacterium]